MDSVLYIREEGNQKREKTSSSFFYHLGAVRDESLMHGFAWEKEARNPLFDSDSPTPVVAFLSVTSKVAASASATRILDIPFSLRDGVEEGRRLSNEEKDPFERIDRGAVWGENLMYGSVKGQ